MDRELLNPFVHHPSPIRRSARKPCPSGILARMFHPPSRSWYIAMTLRFTGMSGFDPSPWKSEAIVMTDCNDDRLRYCRILGGSEPSPLRRLSRCKAFESSFMAESRTHLINAWVRSQNGGCEAGERLKISSVSANSVFIS